MFKPILWACYMVSTIKLIGVLSLFLFVARVSAEGQAEQADPSVACFQSLDSNSDLKSLRNKIALADTRSQTLQMLANNSKPTKKEKEAIQLWEMLLEMCSEKGNDWRQRKYPVQVNALIQQYQSDGKSLIADLYAGSISYGSFAKARASASAKFNSDISSTVERVIAERKAEQDKRDQQAKDEQRRLQAIAQQQAQQQEIARQQQEDQNRQAVMNQFARQQQQQQQFYQDQMRAIQQNTSIRTNCSTYGNQTSCTSR